MNRCILLTDTMMVVSGSVAACIFRHCQSMCMLVVRASIFIIFSIFIFSVQSLCIRCKWRYINITIIIYLLLLLSLSLRLCSTVVVMTSARFRVLFLLLVFPFVRMRYWASCSLCSSNILSCVLTCGCVAV